VGRFNLKKLNDVEVKEIYEVKISNRFAALENLDYDDMDSSRALESSTENLKASDTECSKLLDKRKHTKLQ